jgi:hypothetical protein
MDGIGIVMVQVLPMPFSAPLLSKITAAFTGSAALVVGEEVLMSCDEFGKVSVGRPWRMEWRLAQRREEEDR